MQSLLRSSLLLASLAVTCLAQVGENCLPTLTQTVRTSWQDGSDTMYLVDLDFTNTGYNRQFQESAPHNQDSLPLSEVVFSITTSGSISIVQTWSMEPYPSQPGTFMIENMALAVGSSFTRAGYVARGGVPTVQLDVWGCQPASSPSSSAASSSQGSTTTTTSSSSAASSTSSASTPTSSTTTPAPGTSCLQQTGLSFSLQNSWVSDGKTFSQYSITITNNGATALTFVEFEIIASAAFNIEQSWSMIGEGWTNPAVHPVELSHSVQVAPHSSYSGMGYVASGAPTTSLQLSSVSC